MPLRDGAALQGGKYKIVSFIKAGGFGCTYYGWHSVLEMPVAIKEFFVNGVNTRDEATGRVSVLSETYRDQVSRLEKKFFDEAKNVFRLNHSGIVHVHDVFEENGTAYYVMDYIAGGSLSGKVKKDGPMSEAEALHYVRHAAEAMAFVHSKGRLHLDIKPDNIMIGEGDAAILIDFGVSKQLDRHDGEQSITMSSVLGMTPGYASPEQADGDLQRLSEASDVYSLAATLYTLLTGERPPTASARASGKALQKLPQNVSAKTARAIDRAMRLFKDERTPDMQRFLADLPKESEASTKRPRRPGDTVLAPPHISERSEKTSAPEPPKKPAGKGLNPKLIAVAVACFVIAVLATWLILRRPAAPQVPVVVDNDTVQVKGTTVEAQEFESPAGVRFTFTGTCAKDSIGALYPVNGSARYPNGTYTGDYNENFERHGQGKSSRKLNGYTEDFEGTFEHDSYKQGRLTLHSSDPLTDGSYYEGSFRITRNTYGVETAYDELDGAWYDKNGTVYSTFRSGKKY